MNKDNENLIVFPRSFRLSDADTLAVSNSGIYYMETTGLPVKLDKNLAKNYVGESINIARRMHEHLPKADGSSAGTCSFDEVIAAVGPENVMVKVVCLCDPIYLDYLEYASEKAFATTNKSGYLGANVAPGGKGRFTGMERTGTTYIPRKKKVKSEESLLSKLNDDDSLLTKLNDDKTILTGADFTFATSYNDNDIVLLDSTCSHVLYITNDWKALQEWIRVYYDVQGIDKLVPHSVVLKAAYNGNNAQYTESADPEDPLRHCILREFFIYPLKDIGEEELTAYFNELEE